ncbi:MAG: hypothetical protein R2864_08695 [Syntrophotaleaceae bacterium]
MGHFPTFYKRPYYWPNLWSHNPFVTNPHLIYPGQKVAIYDGRIVFLPEAVDATAADTGDTVTDSPSLCLAERPSRPSAAAKALSALANWNCRHLIDTTDNRLLMTEGSQIFVEIQTPEGLQPGDLYTLVEVGKKIKHPVTGKALGHQTSVVGQARIIDSNPPWPAPW